jgi:hypothetical protein
MWRKAFQRITRTWLLPVLLAGVCGCDRGATVAGKVRYQGRPVIYGSITFLSADKTAHSGVIEPDGSYTVEGVPRGTAKIAVISHDPSKGRSTIRAREAGPPEQGKTNPPTTADNAWFPLPPSLENAKDSGLECTVDSSRVALDIDLK